MSAWIILLLLAALASATLTPAELEAARHNCVVRCNNNGLVQARCMQQCWADFFKNRQNPSPPPPHPAWAPRLKKQAAIRSVDNAAAFRQLLAARRRVNEDVNAERRLEQSLHMVQARGAPPVTTAPSAASTIAFGCATLLAIVLFL